MENLTNRLAGLVIAALLPFVSITPSWGEPPPNPTASDHLGNTAGGTGALESIPDDNGRNNTAFGFNALSSNTDGLENTAIGHGALSNNTSGAYNTATGFGSLFNNLTGYRNSATGDGALKLNTLGRECRVHDAGLSECSRARMTPPEAFSVHRYGPETMRMA
jgi:hypothetical protein